MPPGLSWVLKGTLAAVLTVTAVGAFGANSGDTVRVSEAPDGSGGNGFSGFAATSDDGRYVAFASMAGNLVPGDTNGAADVFVHDLATGTTERVSVASDGSEASTFYITNVDISADGRWVVWDSDAASLVAGDTNGQVDIFIHDRSTGTTERVSVASDGSEGNGFSSGPVVSADGRFVAFASNADNLVVGDSNGQGDIFVHDRDTAQTERVSIASDGTEGENFSSGATISADGRYVAFHSNADNLIPDDTNQRIDVFVHDRQTDVTERVSIASDGSENNSTANEAALSSDGRYVAFHSAGDALVAGDTNGSRDVFVHDRDTGVTQRVSVASDGTEGDANASSPVIAPDGLHVAFSSNAANLVSGDTNGAGDVFVHNRQTGVTHRVSLTDDGTQGNGRAGTPAVSNGAAVVAFDADADNLVPGDTAGQTDIFVRTRSGLLTTPDPRDFGSIRVGRTYGPLSVTITNDYFDQIAVTGVTAPQSPFTAEGGSCGAPPFTLNLGESCDLDFSFSPGAEDTFESTVTLTTDAPGGTHTLTLQGQGVPWSLAIGPSVLDFGAYLPGETGGPEIVELSNADSVAIEVSALDAPTEPFAAAGGSCGAPPFTVAPFDSCTLEYTFSPEHPDSFSDTIGVTHDAASGPDSFDLQGEGLSRALSLSPDVLAFGDIPLGEVGGPQTVTLTSEGDLDVSLDGFSSPAAPFELIGNTCGSVLPAGDSCTLSYRYTPESQTSSLDEVLIESDAEYAPHVLTLFGAGTRYDTELISRATGANGAVVDGFDDSSSGVISDDGRYITFVTHATLDPHDINERGDIYRRDTRTKETILISRASGPDGTGGDWGSSEPTISADGRFVAYRSSSTNLHPDDNDQDPDVFVRDTVTQETILVSRAAGPDGVKGDGWSLSPSLSGDGRYIAFVSESANLHPDDAVAEKRKVFVRDLQTDELILVSRANGPDGEAANDGSVRPSISADGLVLAFETGATNLHPDDDDGHGDIIIRDLQTHQNTLASRATGIDGVKANFGGIKPSISADGSRVAFGTQADNLDPDDPPGQFSPDVYVRDLVTHETYLASRASGEDGRRCEPFVEPNHSNEPSISADGRWVAFESDCFHFYPGETDADDDVFVRDLVTHATHLVSRADGEFGEQGNDDSWSPSISANGRYVAFHSQATNLDLDDTNTSIDVFMRDFLGSAEARVSIDPANIDFGQLTGDGQSATRVVTVTNEGSQVLDLTGIQAPASPFAVTGGTCGGSLSLQAGESCTLELEFAPNAEGIYDDKLVLITSATPDRYNVPLHGERVSDAEFWVDPGSLTATLTPDGVVENVLTLGNQGHADTLDWSVTEVASLDSVVLRPAGTATVPDRPAGAASGDVSTSDDSPAPVTASAGSDRSVPPEEPVPFAPRGSGTTLTHSASNSVVAELATACPASVPNMFLRTFTLSDFGVYNDFDVTEVSFAIEQLRTDEPVTINLYTLEGEFVYNNMRLIGSATQELQAQQFSQVTVPVSANVAAGSTLVVEIEMPGSDIAPPTSGFWPGANSWGESAPSYIALRPSDFLCADPADREPVSFAELGRPQVHLVMAVTGQTEPLDCTLPSWMTVSPGGGTLAPQATESATVTLDASGLDEGERRGFLCLDSTAPRNPQTVVPLTLDVTADSAPAELQISPSDLGFGEVSVGASETASLTVTNAAPSGGDSLEISGIELLSGSPEFEWVGGDCQIGTELLAGESCSVDVQFEPPTQAFHTGALRVQASDGQSISVGLSGTGADAGAADVIFSDDFNQ